MADIRFNTGKLREQLEFSMHLSAQLDEDGGLSNGNLMLPEHISDERISEFISQVTAANDEKLPEFTITPLPILRQKLVIF